MKVQCKGKMARFVGLGDIELILIHVLEQSSKCLYRRNRGLFKKYIYNVLVFCVFGFDSLCAVCTVQLPTHTDTKPLPLTEKTKVDFFLSDNKPF